MVKLSRESGAFTYLKEEMGNMGYTGSLDLKSIGEYLDKVKQQNFSYYKQIKPYHIGATGEQKAIVELQKLPNNYSLINNVRVVFDTPIKIKSTNKQIHSIQVDHVLIGPPGIFLIETKYWSEQTVTKTNLDSPIEQIVTYGQAMFKFLNNAIRTKKIEFGDSWGSRMIPVKNILLMIGAKPEKEYQFVKMLDLESINNYIAFLEREKSSLSLPEINKIEKWLLWRVSSDDKFRSLKTPKYCYHCGININQKWDFCTNCGCKVRKE